jgi:predicted PhzF superfamily epimerase YddE/YHI9
MGRSIHIVDTFADARFAGNPAAVALREAFPADGEMQAEANRIGLPTTAFVVPLEPGAYRVRWFTPHAEINLCGHATIAAARCLSEDPDNAGFARLRFVSDNGVLYTERVGDLICIDLPKAQLREAEPPPGLLEALGADAVSCALSSDDVLIEVATAREVAELRPDFAALARQPIRGHIVTARGDSDGVDSGGVGSDGVDFVSRTFFPSLGVNEDQVCVTAHCKLAPYWAAKLGRDDQLTGLQLSERGGRIGVQEAGDRVRVLGSAVLRSSSDRTGSLAAAGRGTAR